jgi:DNA-binding response OmpR family regulator
MKVAALTEDPEILAELKQLSGVFNFELIQADEHDPACLEKDSVVLIDENFSGSGDWLCKIRETGAESISILFFADNLDGPGKLRDLIIEKKVDVVLGKPLIAKELTAAFRKVLGIDRASSEGSSLDQLPESLIEKYEESKFDNLEKLFSLAEQIGETGAKMKLQEFKNLVHKIAGSAQSFGYAQATKICRRQEHLLAEHLQKDEKGLVDESVVTSLTQFLRELVLNFQHVYPDEPVKSAAIEKGHVKELPKRREDAEEEAILRPLLYLVTQNTSLIGLFQKLATEMRAEVLVETDPQIACEELKEQKFDPYGIVIEDYYPLHHFYGKELIEAYANVTRSRKPEIVLLLKEGDMSRQIEDLEEGITYFLKLPVSAEDISKVMRGIIEKTRSGKGRILVVDDDPIACELVKSALKQSNMEVRALTDEADLYKELDSFAPDLLMLDINMPKYKGWQLLKLLRSDVQYMSLIIVIFTGAEKEGVEDEAFALGADEVVFKPFDPKNLQMVVQRLVRRSQALGGVRNRDPATGFYRELAFHAVFQQMIRQNTDSGKTGIIMLLEMKDFDSLSGFLKAAEVRGVLKKVSNIIRESFQGLIEGSYLGKGKVALLFEDLLISTVLVMFDRFAAAAKKELHDLEYHETAFGAGCCKFRFSEADIHQVISCAQKALDEALTYSESKIIATRAGDDGVSAKENPKLIVVEDDSDLRRMLTYIFEKRGFTVITFDAGQKALSFFAKQKEIDKKTILLLDRMLPDMDGVEILRSLRKKFGKPVKAVFLSSMSSERAVLEGLQEGAVDYITKPFSPQILTQKIEMLLEK